MTVAIAVDHDQSKPVRSAVRLVSAPQPRRSSEDTRRHAGKDAPAGGASDKTRDDRCGPLQSLFSSNSFRQHFQPNSTILLHGEPADAMYMVEAGVVRCCTIDPDGRRQIFSFLKRGEFFGLSDFDRWHFTAEAVDHVVVRSIPRAVVEQSLAVNVSLCRRRG